MNLIGILKHSKPKEKKVRLIEFDKKPIWDGIIVLTMN
jgi:hypothetical protein